MKTVSVLDLYGYTVKGRDRPMPDGPCAVRPDGFQPRPGYSELAANVSHCFTLPLSRPRLNQRTRWADVPCVKASGTT